MSNQQSDSNNWTKHSNKQSNSRGGFSSYNSQPRGRGRGTGMGNRGGSSQRGGRGGYSNNYNGPSQQQQQPQTATTQPQSTGTTASNNGFYRGGSSYNKRGAPKYYPQQHSSQQPQQHGVDEEEDETNQSTNTSAPQRQKSSVKSNVQYPMRTVSAPPTVNHHHSTSERTPTLPQSKTSTLMQKPNLRNRGLNPNAPHFLPTQAFPIIHHPHPQPIIPQPVIQQPPQQQAEKIEIIPPRKEKTILKIVDPATLKEINIGAPDEEDEEQQQQQQEEQQNSVAEQKEVPSVNVSTEAESEKPTEESNGEKIEAKGENEEAEDEEDEEDEEGDEDEEYDSEFDDYDSDDYSSSDDETLINGKRVYSRDAMLRLQPKGTEAPAEVKNIEIYFDPTSGKDQTSRHTTGYLTKTSSRPSRHPRTSSGASPSPRTFKKKDPFSSKRTKSGTRPTKRKSRKDAFEQLTRSENAWKIGQTKDEADKIYKEVTFILNILTPEKYDVLKGEFLKIKIESEEVLKGVIDIIFEKAVFEPTFAGLYALLCKDMANAQSQASTGAEDKDKEAQARLVGFKRTLLNKCQNEFEAENKADAEDLSNLNEVELEDRLLKIRRRKIGNIIFIGELFDKKMLSEKIIHEVIKKLLIESNTNTREDDLERLCKLLTTIGKSLDHEKASRYMDLYFSKMRDASQDKTLSSRIKFMLMDCIELRENNWVPRIKTAKAKTIKEVHADAEKEKKQKELSLKAKTGKGYYKGGSNVSSPLPNKGPKKIPSTNDMFQTKERDKQQRKKTYDRQYKNEVRLGPSSSQNAWVSRDKNEKVEKNKKEDVTASNTFAALDEENQSADDYESNDEKETLNTEHIENRTRGVFNTYVEEGEREASIEEFKKENFSKDAIIYSIRCLVYLCINNQNDMGEYFKLLKALFEEQLISSNAIYQGLANALSDIITTEFYFDAPLTFKIYGQLTGRLVFEKLISFDNVSEILAPLVSSVTLTNNQAIEIIISMMEAIAEEHEYADKDNGIEKSRQALFESSYNFLNIIDSSHKKQTKLFASQVKDKKLDALDTVASVLLFAEEHVANDDADSGLLDLLHKDLGDDSVLSSVPYSTKIFSGLFVAGEHLDKTKDFINQYKKTYQTILASQDAQAKCISEIHKYSNNARRVDAFVNAVKLFTANNLFTEGAVDQWKKDKKDKTPRKQEVIEALE